MARPRQLLEPGLTQSVEEVVDTLPVGVEAGQDTFDEGEVGVERFQVSKRALCLLDPAQLAQPRHDVTQTRRPIAVEGPSATADLDCLVIMTELVMSTGERGQPDKQARVAR